MAKRKNRKVTAEKSQNAGKHLKANRKYKDTVFRMLFSDRKIYCHFIMRLTGRHMIIRRCLRLLLWRMLFI